MPLLNMPLLNNSVLQIEVTWPSDSLSLEKGVGGNHFQRNKGLWNWDCTEYSSWNQFQRFEFRNVMVGPLGLLFSSDFAVL